MTNTLRRPKWIILTALIFLVGAMGAFLFQRQISRAESMFPPPIAEIPLAADKRTGVNVDLTAYTEAELHEQLKQMQAARLTWLRQSFQWDEIEPEPGQFRWERYDSVVETARTYGFEIIAVIENTPAWARAEGTSPATPPLEATDFGRFAREFARHYQPKITHYQIWHEPNLSERWGNRYVSPADYVLLLKNAAINIRAVQPEAKIITAGLAPTVENGPLNLNEAAYLQGMYRAGAALWFDVVAGQLYGFNESVAPAQTDANLLNLHRVNLLRRVMETNGDGDKPIWATIFGWNALPADWSGRPSPWPADTPEKQLARTEAAIDYARANWPWLGPILGARWDAAGLDSADPALGFAINSALLPPFEDAGRNKAYTATVGSYPAMHITGQYSPGWNRSPTGADIPRPTDEFTENPTLTIPFEGTRLDLKLNRGAYQGYLRVSVDGLPSKTLPADETGRSYVVLNDPLGRAATVTVARYLPDGQHTAVIEAEGGWGQWAISGWNVHREADTRALTRWLAICLLAVAATGGLLLRQPAFFVPRGWRSPATLWNRAIDLVEPLPYTRQLALTLILAAAFWLLPGSMALLVLPLLGLLFLLNPEMGLLLTGFSISFFLAKKPLPVGTFGVLELVLALTALATLLRLFLSRKTGISAREIVSLKWLNAADWGALALAAVAIVTTFTADNIGVAVYELRTVIAGSVVFYFLIRLLPRILNVDRTQFARRLMNAFVAGAALHAATALFQYGFAPEQTITAEGVQRAIGYLYGSPNNLSLFLERALPISAALVLFGSDRKERLWHGLALLMVGAALFLTYSKGSLLLAIPAALLFLALVRGGKNAWLGAGSGLILLAVALIPLSRTVRFRNTFSLEPGSTAFSRIKLWQSAWRMFKEHPLTGVGPDNFLYAYRTRYILPEAWAEPDLNHPHNLILDFGTRIGLGGIVVLIWLQARFWIASLKGYFGHSNTQAKILLLGLMASMITFLVHGLIDNSFFLVDLAYTFFLTLGLTEELTHSANQQSS